MATFKELNLQNAKLQADNEQLAEYGAALLKLFEEVHEVATVTLDRGFLSYRTGLKAIKAMTTTAYKQNAEARQGLQGNGNDSEGTRPIPFSET